MPRKRCQVKKAILHSIIIRPSWSGCFSHLNSLAVSVVGELSRGGIFWVRKLTKNMVDHCVCPGGIDTVRGVNKQMREYIILISGPAQEQRIQEISIFSCFFMQKPSKTIRNHQHTFVLHWDGPGRPWEASGVVRLAGASIYNLRILKQLFGDHSFFLLLCGYNEKVWSVIVQQERLLWLTP